MPERSQKLQDRTDAPEPRQLECEPAPPSDAEATPPEKHSELESLPDHAPGSAAPAPEPVVPGWQWFYLLQSQFAPHREPCHSPPDADKHPQAGCAATSCPHRPTPPVPKPIAPPDNPDVPIRFGRATKESDRCEG